MKLHLGCGKKYLKGFVHVDLLKYDHIDFIAPIDDLHFAKNSSVEMIYASHVLEHVGRNSYEKVLDEWYRVLKPKGILRVAVPDFGACVQNYLATENLSELLGLLTGGQKDEHDYHKMIFDEKLLTNSLIKSGFKEVKKYDWRETESVNLDDFSQAYLPHMNKETGLLMSLNLEAVK